MEPRKSTQSQPIIRGEREIEKSDHLSIVLLAVGMATGSGGRRLLAAGALGAWPYSTGKYLELVVEVVVERGSALEVVALGMPKARVA